MSDLSVFSTLYFFNECISIKPGFSVFSRTAETAYIKQLNHIFIVFFLMLKNELCAYLFSK